MTTAERYVPAAGRAGLTRYYEGALAVTMRERRWRPMLTRRLMAAVPHGGRVLDVGAGTGRQAIALAAARPDVRVIAIDGDPEALEIAQRKPGASAVRWEIGLAGEIDQWDASADAAVMSLLLHHLGPASKRRALEDVARVLRPGGHLHIADWGAPARPVLRASFFVLQLLDGFEGTRDHVAGRLPGIVIESGFSSVMPYARLRTPWGALHLLDAVV